MKKRPVWPIQKHILLKKLKKFDGRLSPAFEATNVGDRLGTSTASFLSNGLSRVDRPLESHLRRYSASTFDAQFIVVVFQLRNVV